MLTNFLITVTVHCRDPGALVEARAFDHGILDRLVGDDRLMGLLVRASRLVVDLFLIPS